MEKSAIVKLSPPQYAHHRKVQALFGRDPQVHIKDLADLGNGQYSYMILVEDKAKAEAIKAILKNPMELGNLKLTAIILGPDEDDIVAYNNISKDVYDIAFSGNPIFEKTILVNFYCFSFTYCVFKKEIIQFWNDDLSNYCCNYTGLPSDVAREILYEDNISFCISAE